MECGNFKGTQIFDAESPSGASAGASREPFCCGVGAQREGRLLAGQRAHSHRKAERPFLVSVRLGDDCLIEDDVFAVLISVLVGGSHFNCCLVQIGDALAFAGCVLQFHHQPNLSY